jgi:hypothetical protein
MPSPSNVVGRVPSRGVFFPLSREQNICHTPSQPHDLAPIQEEVAPLHRQGITPLPVLCVPLRALTNLVVSGSLFSLEVYAMKTRTFKISFKMYYHELSEWSSDYIAAKSKSAALRSFIARHKIKEAKLKHQKTLRWWEGDWYMVFQLIEEVPTTPKVCPHCRGSGTLATC